MYTPGTIGRMISPLFYVQSNLYITVTVIYRVTAVQRFPLNSIVKLKATWLTRVSRFRVNSFLRVTICPVSGCIGRIEERFDVETVLLYKTAAQYRVKQRLSTSFKCFNQGTMTKVKNNVVQLCYSYSDY